MAALFDRAVIYEIEAVCKTPLRTGNTDGEADQILRYKDGTPFIQGNSISGALRYWLEKNKYIKEAEVLFGSQKKEGHLIISDGIFEKNAEVSSRTGIVIDKHTGTVEKGKKFDTLHIVTGQKMRFDITWTGRKEEAGQIELIEQMLSAMNQGNIRLGAKKTSGFGLFTLNVKKREYDLMAERDRKDWLSGIIKGNPVKLKTVSDHTVTEFVVSGRADAVLIKAAVAEHQDEGSYVRNMMEGKVEVIPGASVKGAVRARVEEITELMGVDSTIPEEMFGSDVNSCADQKAGNIYFEDILLDKTQKEKITRIRINRFTGGVIRGNLFREEPLCTDIKMRITAPDHPEYCMLLVYALRDLGAGLYNIGSGGSIGRGYISVDTIQISDCRGRKAVLKFDKDRKCICQDNEKILEEWAEKLEERV